MLRKPTEAAFSLIELIVVVAILLLLAGVLVPLVTKELDAARMARAQTDLKTAADAFNRYYSHTSTWPGNSNATPKQFAASSTSGNLTGYACLYTNAFNRKGWNGPYLNSGVSNGGTWTIATAGSGTTAAKGLVDPWGNLYRVYTYAKGTAIGAGGGIVLHCAGPNLQFEMNANQCATGTMVGDDLIQIVTRGL